jgi:imidazoleglycerol phosphate synthase glutamine amidotransferase subunit HisH
MQWNQTRPLAGRSSVLLAPFSACSPPVAGPPPDDGAPWFYYVHSYAAFVEGDDASDAAVATCDYGKQVVAVVERDGLYGTQFHPEKSGRAGLRLLGAFVELCGER